MNLERVSTGIMGLDSLIEGGIPKGFTVLVSGNPGTGKTILGAHFLFEGLARGENSLYVSFSESKEQFQVNMENLGMNFRDFDSQGKFVFLDFASITQEGMRDALEEVLATVTGTGTRRLVVDSISAISHSYQNQIINARIILQTVLGKILRLEGVTSMLIAEIPTGRDVIGLGIEESITDGNIWLKHGPSDASPLILTVLKMRGTKIVKEPHVCMVSSEAGMTLYPKQSLNLIYPATNERLTSGIYGIDQRTGGGFLKGTVTGVVGPAGTGKTTIGFQFIAEGVRMGEAGIFYSLEESVEEIKRMAENYGYDVSKLERKGLRILAKNPEYQSPDAFIAEIANEIEKGKAKRLAVDGLTSFAHAIIPEADSVILIAKRLASLSRENAITTVFSILSTQQSDVLLKDLGGLSTLFQNIIVLRHTEVEGKMKRAMVALKMRSTSHDESFLQFDISPIETADDGDGPSGWWTKGPIKITGSLEGYGGIMSAVAHRMPKEFRTKEQEILHKETLARSKRSDEFQQREEDIASLQQDEGKKRVSRYKVKKLRRGGVGDNKTIERKDKQKKRTKGQNKNTRKGSS